MRRAIRRAFAITLCALALPISGCDLSFLTVRIPDFDSKKIRGIWISRRSETSGQYVHVSKVTFQTLTTVSGSTILSYLSVVGPLGESASLTTGLQRDRSNPDIVTLKLGFQRLAAPGLFKVSTFNQVGESPLSTETKQL